MPKTCAACGEEKPLREFRKAGRGHSRTCLACESGEPAPDDTPEPKTLLELRPGYGLKVWVDSDGDLVLAQEQAEGEVRVYLAPQQVPQLAQFLSPVKEATP